MNKLLVLLLSACLLVTGCGKEKEEAPIPILPVTKNAIQYQVNNQPLTQVARVSYQPASLPTRSFDLLTIEAGDSTKAAAKEYVQVVFLKGAGRPESEYGIVAIRFIDSANNLTWGINLQGTAARSSTGWNGSFAGTATDKFNQKVVIGGAFNNVL